ncbi:MAG: division/cell wall cluster transcriptional repressor MraZ [Candidatus Eremiobacteraeota bacterium]|nr:division/cell wall cluster transcriptional repressor MraZ [Candidatus Eremiobacteraeota bacterium]MBV8353835.1 division/cell wall cluster transcriptional repressor MraZ [Candidatus Eremiobacteraeota bacterium]
MGFGVVRAEVPRFTGSVEHALDDKGRLVVPARFRERLGAGFYLTVAEPEPCLALYPSVTWAEFCEKLEAAPVKDGRYRRLVRFIFANTEEATCDPQGRLAIPAHLRSYGELRKDVVSVGSLTRVEIWAKERYRDRPDEADDFGRFVTELGLF